MAKSKVTQQQVDQLIEDAAYLQKEVEALQYVIDEVPHNESPPDGPSIAEMLLLIDHAQTDYYEPIFDDVLTKKRPARLSNFDHFKETFHPGKEALEDIQKLLETLAKHRGRVVNKFKKNSITNWQSNIYDDNKEILLMELMNEMVRFDQTQLKKITKLVMVFNQEKENRRDLKRRQIMHNPQINNH